MNRTWKLALAATAITTVIAGGAAYASTNVQSAAAAVNSQGNNPGKQPPNGQRFGQPNGAPNQADPNAAPQAQPKAAPIQQNTTLRARLKSVDGTTLVLDMPQRGMPRQQQGAATPANNETRVATDASTKFVVNGVAAATIANFKAGDDVAILLSKPVDRANLKASAVALMPKPESVSMAGSAKSASATGLTLTRRNAQDVAVSITGSTKVVVVGNLAGKITDIKDGDKVTVDGKPLSDTAIEASVIVVNQKDGNAVHFDALVVAINGSKLSVWTSLGNQIEVDVSQAVFMPLQAKRTLADIKVGEHINGVGVKTSDTAVTAQVIGGMGGPAPMMNNMPNFAPRNNGQQPPRNAPQNNNQQKPAGSQG